MNEIAQHSPLTAELLELANQGNAFLGQGKFNEAINVYCAVLAQKPDFAEVHNNLGVVYQIQGLWDKAIECHSRALVINPNYAQAYQNLAKAFDMQGNFAASLECYQKGLFIAPNSIELHFNLGLSFAEQGKLDEAIASLQRAIAIAPNLPEAYLKLGELLKKQGHPEQAIESYQKAIFLKPDYAEARMFLGVALLTLGDFAAGWQYWEARYDPKMPNSKIKPPPFNFPQWQGQTLAGKSILLWPEQGLGDSIQFCRYIKVLKEELGASYITLFCPDRLKSLLETVAGVDKVLIAADAINVRHHDYWAYLLSIPLHCNTTMASIPATVPYLYAKPKQIKQMATRFNQVKELRVGLCWKGNPAFINDKNRSPGIAPFAALFKVAGVKFFTLQPGSRDEFLAAAGSSGFDFGRELNESSFDEATAVMANLDLIISSDTSLAHLAGALGKPLWVVLSFDPDWRWFVKREDSPWYPTARLFRQPQRGDWASVFNQIEHHLKEMVDNR